ncbi:zinc metallopeptidase [Elizabethkingia sp. JS20170427COW]|nr:zinc metallopeptidase [Elizabethkingia sp. JS20170427COW]QCX52589.1 zinc metallopeptidase [Elizabethkingia sp. JS20170427COW]
MYFIIFILVFVAGIYVDRQLKSKFNHYSQLHLRNNLSGKEIAEKMLRDNGIYDVSVISIPGQLTDHYNPENKTVNLSEAVYMQRNAAAAAVAAHECGHAIQHAQSYSMLELRSKLVPMVSFSSRIVQFVLLGGMAVMAFSGNKTILAIGVLLFAVTTIFSFVTLPVEYDASNRALKWLQDKQMLVGEEHYAAQDALKWAARTYVVAAVGSLANLIYFASMLSGGNNDE